MLRSLGRRRCEVQCPMIDPSASSTLRPVSELKPSSGSHANLSHRFAGSAEVRTCHRTGRAVLRHRPPTPQNAQVILSLSSGGIVHTALYRVEVHLTRSKDPWRHGDTKRKRGLIGVLAGQAGLRSDPSMRSSSSFRCSSKRSVVARMSGCWVLVSTSSLVQKMRSPWWASRKDYLRSEGWQVWWAGYTGLADKVNLLQNDG